MPLIHTDNWHVASIFDEEGNVVQFNILTDESGFEMEPILQTHTAGDYQSGDRDAIILVSTDQEGADQLAEWKKNHTPVSAVALSTEQSGRGYRFVSFRKLKEFLPQLKALRSEADNALRAVIEDFDVNPVRAKNLAFGQQDSIVLPISGVTLTLAGEKATAFDLELEAFDIDGISLGSVTDSFPDGRGSVDLELPSGTWEVAWVTNGAENISLRTAGSSTYVEG